MRKKKGSDSSEMQMPQEQIIGITFAATVNKITTTIDGGWRVTLDVPNSDTFQMGQLSQKRNAVLQIGVVDLNSSAYNEETNG